ncbi:hypothetical protein FRC12_019361 [Ceratobasidium sp. 428]|nr:hypothetical protein FRC12_019361 [Ceratobasidium sp. 428]
MITDFGNAVLQQGTLQFTETRKALQFTPRWTAPELLMNEKITLSEEADVYALGMTVLVCELSYNFGPGVKSSPPGDNNGRKAILELH